ncbi:hypothetical protein FBU30_005009 [Linnemannia zychae]|nr:hypothetical protein FBU30_005009 [Linnemannia zychae]
MDMVDTLSNKTKAGVTEVVHAYGHQQQDSVQSMQQFYHLYDYRRNEDHSSIQYYTTEDYRLDLNDMMSNEISNQGYQQQQQSESEYMHCPQTPEQKLIMNRSSIDQIDGDVQFSPPPHTQSNTDATLSTTITEMIATMIPTTSEAKETPNQQNANANNNHNTNNPNFPN